MNNDIKVDLAILRDSPFVQKVNFENHVIHGPLHPLPSENEETTMQPYIEMVIQNRNPFIILSYNSNGEEISYVWNGPGSSVSIEDGHINPETDNRNPSYITCKWYAPSEDNIKENIGYTLPDNYLFDKPFPNIRQCTNPDPSMGIACGFAFDQPCCQEYEAEVVKTPVHFKDKNSDNSIITRDARINDGIRVIQIIESINNNETIRTYDTPSMPLESLIAEANDTAINNFTGVEEVPVVSLRKSFIKRIINL